MTYTNQASELHELCKEVYEKTGWEAPETYKAEDGNPENDWQAYDTDYLLEKLPKRIDNDEVNWLDIYYEDDPDCWRAGYEYAKSDKWGDSYDVVADTPLKALLKLTIALSEAGELNE